MYCMKNFSGFTMVFLVLFTTEAKESSFAANPDGGKGNFFPAVYQEFSTIYHRNARTTTSLANDDQYLYVTLSTRDPFIQRKLLRAGLKVEFLVPRISDDPARILFPGYDKDQLPTTAESQPDSDLGRMKQAYIFRTTRFMAEGFRMTNGQLVLNRRSDISARISMDSLELRYEMIIPLSEFFDERFRVFEMKKNEIIVSSILESLGKSPSRQGRDQYDFPPDRGRGMTPPGGIYRPGGMQVQPVSRPMPAMMEDADLLYRTQKIRHKFRLSFGK
jgi:hypothetical protein